MTTIKFYARRANGGYLHHAVESGKHIAICGFEPSSPVGTMIKGRGRWTWRGEKSEVSCKKCLDKLTQKHEQGE